VRCRQRVPRKISGNIDGCRLYSRLKVQGQESSSFRQNLEIYATRSKMCVRVEGPPQIQNAETANVEMGDLPVLQVGEDLVGSVKT